MTSVILLICQTLVTRTAAVNTAEEEEGTARPPSFQPFLRKRHDGLVNYCRLFFYKNISSLQLKHRSGLWVLICHSLTLLFMSAWLQDVHTWAIPVFNHQLAYCSWEVTCGGPNQNWFYLPVSHECLNSGNKLLYTLAHSLPFIKLLFLLRETLTVFWTYYKHRKVNISLTRSLLGFYSGCVCCRNEVQTTR